MLILDNWNNVIKLLIKIDFAHFRLDLSKIGIVMLILACINPIGSWQDPVWYSFWVYKPKNVVLVMITPSLIIAIKKSSISYIDWLSNEMSANEVSENFEDILSTKSHFLW